MRRAILLEQNDDWIVQRRHWNHEADRQY